MKRIFVAFILFFTALLYFAPQAAAQNTSAVIREIMGAVELKKSGASEWIPAKTGDVIEKKTIISTSFRSTAVLAVGNSTITVRPLTRLSFEELLTLNETETVNINLNTGRVRVEVTPAAGNRADFTIQSPSTTASVRGTAFEMDTESIQVLEGKVSYASTDGPVSRPVVVGAGEESRIDASGGIVVPMAAEDAVRVLPNLPGQSDTPVQENTRLDFGSLVFNVEVIMNN